MLVVVERSLFYCGVAKKIELRDFQDFWICLAEFVFTRGKILKEVMLRAGGRVGQFFFFYCKKKVITCFLESKKK